VAHHSWPMISATERLRLKPDARWSRTRLERAADLGRHAQRNRVVSGMNTVSIRCRCRTTAATCGCRRRSGFRMTTEARPRRIHPVWRARSLARSLMRPNSASPSWWIQRITWRGRTLFADLGKETASRSESKSSKIDGHQRNKCSGSGRNSDLHRGGSPVRPSRVPHWRRCYRRVGADGALSRLLRVGRAIRSRFFWIALPLQYLYMTGPEIMKFTRSLKTDAAGAQRRILLLPPETDAAFWPRRPSNLCSRTGNRSGPITFFATASGLIIEGYVNRHQKLSSRWFLTTIHKDSMALGRKERL